MILAGDIGGTKSYLALFDESKNRLGKIRETRFENRKFPDFDSIIEEFLKDGNEKPRVACMGVAGPIVDGNCSLTNLDWRVETGRLKKQIDKVYLINDLVALACAVPCLEDKDVAVLQPGLQLKEGRISVVAAGTGLGHAFLIPTGSGKYYAVDSEGGHADFAPRNKLETELLFFLQKKFARVSVERVVSGPGVVHIFEFIKEYFYSGTSEDWQEGLRNEELAAEIISCAVKKQSELCEKTLSLFVELYGALAGNLALQFLSKGGIYLGGGIVPRILPLLKQGLFMQSFLEKGRFKNFLTEFPVKVILNDRSALLGAAQYAFKHQ
ncbi:MAG: glucokinase [Nitrospinales bacterium]|jgi:glucokinase